MISKIFPFLNFTEHQIMSSNPTLPKNKKGFGINRGQLTAYSNEVRYLRNTNDCSHLSLPDGYTITDAHFYTTDGKPLHQFELIRSVQPNKFEIKYTAGLRNSRVIGIIEAYSAERDLLFITLSGLRFHSTKKYLTRGPVSVDIRRIKRVCEKPINKKN